MRKLLMRALFPIVVAVGAALTLSTPAHATDTIKVRYMTPAELASICNEMGGWFDDFGSGDSMCTLPDGRHMVCSAMTNSCVWVYIWLPGTGWRDVVGPIDWVLQDPTSPPTPPRPSVPVVVTDATLTSR